MRPSDRSIALLATAVLLAGCRGYYDRNRPADGSVAIDVQSLDQTKDGGDATSPELGCPPGCKAETYCVAGKCECFKGMENSDNDWNTGCQGMMTPCNPVSCEASTCGAQWCGPNAECRPIKTATGTDHRCRCINGGWDNLNRNWEDGCEAAVAGCSPTNCNACYEGYCGDFADCTQNSCSCLDGYENCDGEWEENGCGCKVGTCGACNL